MIKLTDQQCEALGVPKGTSIDEQVKPGQIQVLPSGAMTLRDYFAAAALTGLLAADPNRYTDPASYWSKDAYAHADAMLEERRVSYERRTF